MKKVSKCLFLTGLFIPLWFFANLSVAKAETCYWRGQAGMNALMSNPSNWNSPDPSGCRLNSGSRLVFGALAAIGTPSYYDRAATWDNSLTNVGPIEITSSYTGMIVINAPSATVYGNLAQGGGILNLNNSNLRITGSLYTNGGSIYPGSATISLGCVPTSGPGGIPIPCLESPVPLTLGGNTNPIFDKLVINGHYQLGQDITVRNQLTVATSARFKANSHRISLTGNQAAPFLNNGTFEAGSGIVSYAIGVPNITLANAGYYNLMLNSIVGSNPTYTVTNDLNINNDLTVMTNVTLNLGNRNLNLQGNFSNYGNINQTAGYVNSYRDGGSLNTTGTTNVNHLLVFGSNQTLGGTGNISLNNLQLAGGSSASLSLNGSIAVRNLVRVETNSILNLGTSTLMLDLNIGNPLTILGTLNVNNSTVAYRGTGAVTLKPMSYYNLNLSGGGNYTLVGNTTVTNSFYLRSFGASQGILSLGNFALNVPSPTFINLGSINELPSGTIRHPASSIKITDESGAEINLLNTAVNSVYITVRDDDANLNGSVVENISTNVSIRASTYNDTENVTLTETGQGTGIFRSMAMQFSVAGSAVNGNGRLEVSGNGTLTLNYSDSRDPTDVGGDTANFTGIVFGTSPGVCAVPVAGTSPIAINGGSAETNAQSVSLTLSATNASEMIISNSLDFSGLSWESYSANRTGWFLTAENGLKNVYVKFRSSCGAITGPFSDSITLSQTTPAPGSPPPAPGGYTVGDSIYPAFTPSSPASQLTFTNVFYTYDGSDAIVRIVYRYQNLTGVRIRTKAIIEGINNATGLNSARRVRWKYLRPNQILQKKIILRVPRNNTYMFRVRLLNSRTRTLLESNSFTLSLN